MKRKIPVLFLFLSVAVAAVAQITTGVSQFNILTGPNGEPLRYQSAAHSDGSPYYYENWLPASIFLTNGKAIEKVQVKMDLIKQEIHYMSEATGQEMIAYGAMVKEFYLAEPSEGKMVTRKYSFQKLDGSTSYLCQHLAEGTATLFKSIVKRELTDKAYHSATVNVVFQEDINYYLFAEGKFTKLSKRKGDLIELLPGKTDELQKYVAEKKMKLRSEEEMAELVNYFNSLN
ncbi:MAG: hypothetical protein ACK5DD_16145 [Cyclobacteriaceae bacterium]|jgi:hypothetical protein